MANKNNKGKLNRNGSYVKHSTPPKDGIVRQVWKGLPARFEDFRADYNKEPPYNRVYEDDRIRIEMPPWAASAYKDKCRVFVVSVRLGEKKEIVESMRPHYGSVEEAIEDVESYCKPARRKEKRL